MPTPLISNVTATNVDQTTAGIGWDVSQFATGQVEYGTTTAYGSLSTPEITFNYDSHYQILSGLSPGRLYHFRVKSANAGGILAVSGDYTFTTLAASPTPTPLPTATPTPTASPAPTPAPTSAPSGARPFAAPTTSGTRTVPATIDATGSSDASTALNTFIRNSPDGSLISFPAGGTYRLDKGLLLAGRNNLVLDGNGATLLLRGSGNDEAASAFLLRGSNHVAISDFTVVGNNPNTTTIFNGGTELQHVLSLSGWYGGQPSTYVEISNVTASHLYADGAYLEGQNVAPYAPSHHVWIHNNDWSYIGRNAVSSINVNDVLVEDNRFDKIAMDAWDLEPNLAVEQVRRNTFRRNTVGSYGHMTQFLGWFVGSWNPTNQSPISDIVVTDNTVAGLAVSGYDGSPRGLTSRFTSPGSRITFTNNTSSRAVRGPAITFANIAGVTVGNNQQTLLSGSLTSFTNCTGIQQ